MQWSSQNIILSIRNWSKNILFNRILIIVVIELIASKIEEMPQSLSMD